MYVDLLLNIHYFYEGSYFSFKLIYTLVNVYNFMKLLY